MHLSPLDPDPTTPALAVRDLTKRFGDKLAANRINLDIPRGSIYGIVGPNGAGKTTMISMVAGLLRPTSGDSWVAGYHTWRQPLEAKKSFGLLADGLSTFDLLSGPEYLSFLGGLRRMAPEVVDARCAELLAALGLEEAGDKQIAKYSAGMTKKILLAGALLHNPRVLILDEPLEAVDPVSGRLIQEILRSFADHGGTVVLSSHVMSLVEGLCTHVAVIANGQVRTSGTVDEVRDGRSLTDVFVEIAGGGELADDALGWLGGSDERA